jgi:hypothetical protein
MVKPESFRVEGASAQDARIHTWMRKYPEQLSGIAWE